jgi:coenzyme F420-reducing hydrogenase delta subunit
MKKRKVDQNRFQIEWISATEGKKFQRVMTDMSDAIKRVPITKPEEPPPKKIPKKKMEEATATGD